MSRFDERYDIRRARPDEIPEIMRFISEHWKKGHILSSNREFFEYEMVVDGQVNFLIAKDRKTGAIDGILGYLPCSLDRQRLDTWGVLWKTREGALPMLGIELKRRLFPLTGARTDLGVGANESTSVPLLSRVLRYYTAKMRHYYRLNDLPSYHIARVEHKDIPGLDARKAEGARVSLLETAERLRGFLDFRSLEGRRPYKDFWYYDRRFYRHPIYAYRVWGIAKGADRAFFVTRDQEHGRSRALSIVDYAGDPSLFPACGPSLDALMREGGYEYADFYFDGFDEDAVRAAGFVRLEDGDANVIPAHFRPFEQRNVDIYVDSSDRENRYAFFKADGDQDRPS